ncbi:hypothetical protein WG66_003214 [Moniliophthora roreri]|nr:hypothetical protein WG66_003214 [Moniliophthora roreri]
MKRSLSILSAPSTTSTSSHRTKWHGASPCSAAVALPTIAALMLSLCTILLGGLCIEGHRNFDAQDEYQNFASSAAASLYSARGNEITALKNVERDKDAGQNFGMCEEGA